MNSSNNLKGVLLVALSAVSYGLMPLFANIAYAAGTSTYTLLFLRFLVGAVFMAILITVRKLPLPSLKDALSFILLGAVGYAGQSFCYFTALKHASASVVALLLYTYPALVMIGSAVLFKEKMTAAKGLALCLALMGAFVIIGSEYSSDSYGIILSVLSAVCYSTYILINSRIVKPGMSVQSSALIMIGATISYGILNLADGFHGPDQPGGYLGVILLALISTVLAFWSFLAGMEKTGASTAALVSTLEPVVTVVSSVLFLAEQLTFHIILGGGLVMMALLLTCISERSEANR